MGLARVAHSPDRLAQPLRGGAARSVPLSGCHAVTPSRCHAAGWIPFSVVSVVSVVLRVLRVLLRKWGPGLGGLLNGDFVPKRFQLTKMPLARAVALPAIEVVAAEFVIRDPIAHDVVRDLENLMPSRHDRFLVPPMAFDPVVSRLQGGPLRVTGGEPGLDEAGAQIRVRLARLPRPPLARALVLGLGLHTTEVDTSHPTFADVLPPTSDTADGSGSQMARFDYIEEAVAHGLMQGGKGSDGQALFWPKATVRRIDLALAVAKAAGLPTSPTITPGVTTTTSATTLPFTDLPAQAQQAVAAVVQAGFVTADGGTFRPWEPESRSHAARVLLRLFSALGLAQK